MKKFLQSRSEEFWGKCTLIVWLIIMFLCTSLYYSTLSVYVKVPILFLLLYVYAECIHMKARILGFAGGRELGDTEGYQRAEHEFSYKRIKEDSVQRNKFFVFLNRAPLLTSVAWDKKNHGLVIQGAYVAYPDDYKNTPPVCLGADRHEKINENLGPIYYFRCSGENDEILALDTQEEFDAMNKKAR